MKWMTARLVGLGFAALSLGACGGVWLDSRYSALLDQTVALSEETAKRTTTEPFLTPQEMALSLQGQARIWRRFKDAKDGKGGGE